MVKKFAPPPRATVSRSSIRLPSGMKDTMEQVMVGQGCSLKRRSNWIAAACESLLADADREDLIREEFYDGKTVALPLAIDTDLVARMDSLAAHMTSPQRTVDRSSVIRTAITQAVLTASGRRLNTDIPRRDDNQNTGVPQGDTP